MTKIRTGKAYVSYWDDGKSFCELEWYPENIKCGKAKRVRVIPEADYQRLIKRRRTTSARGSK